MQRQWWAPAALFGTFALAGMIGIMVEDLSDRETTVGVLAAGVIGIVGAFYSGGLLRQRQAADASGISVSSDGTLSVHVPSGDVARSLAGATGLAIRHGTNLQQLYGAEVPPSLNASGAAGEILIRFEDRLETISFTGQLPLEGQRQLLAAATPFLVGEVSISDAVPTPDERYEAASFGRRVRDVGVMLLVVLVGLIPVGGVIALQTAIRGHLDPNTRWFAILLWVLSPIAIVGLALWARRRR